MRNLLDWFVGRHSLRLTSIGRFGDKVINLEWSPGGDMLAISPTTSLAGVYRLGSREPIYEFETSDRCGLGQLCWSRGNGMIAAGGLDASVRIWNAHGECIDVMREGGISVEALAWNQTGTMLAVCSRRRLRLWNCERARIQEEYALHDGSSGSVCWRGDDELFVGTSEGVMTWRSGERRFARLSSQKTPVRAISLSSRGRFLAIADAEPELTVRELDTGTEAIIGGHDGHAHALSWSGDDRYLAVRTPAGVAVHDWSGFPGSNKLLPHVTARRVSAIAFQNEGSLLAVGLSTKQVGLFDPARDRRQMVIADVDAPINILRWSQDGRRLAVAGDDGSVLLYELR